MPVLTRRRLLSACGLGALAALAARVALPRWWRVGPPRPLEGELAAWVGDRLARLDLARVWDTHVHAVGIGPETGCWVNPTWRSHLHPVRRLQFELYLGASGIELGPGADGAYVQRLIELQRMANPAGRSVLLAFDWFHGEDGARRQDLSSFHVPDEYVLDLAQEHPDALAAGASIHPYRSDALDRLDAAAARGAVLVKWLPASQGIDPASPLCDAFYERLAALDLPLLVHAGAEHAVDAARQKLGNPLRLRRALDAGARVIVAHCAGLGEALDLDEPEAGRVPCSDLFLRLMDEERYRGRLFGGLSATTLVNRCGAPLARLLGRADVHPRLLFGSDYPLTAIEPATSTWLLARRGYLGDGDRGRLEEVFDANPLLFDLVLKACLIDPARRAEGPALSPAAFHTRDHLERA